MGLAATPDGGGYWEAAADGGVFSYGDARYYGSMGGQTLDDPIAAIVTDHAGKGYWLLPTSPPNVPPLPVLEIPRAYGAGYWGRFPTIIYFSADAGNIVSRISWSSWGRQEAVGHGTWTYDDCVPDCAQGSDTPYPATVTLSGAAHGVYTQLEEVTSGPHRFTIVDHLGAAAWPLGASN